MNPAADIARTAAEVAGRIILEAAGPGHATDKGLPGDYVTQVDLAAERAIAQVLEERSPGVPMLGEESGRSGDLGSLYWVVDPLDGTTNFLHGFPVVGVSVALVQGDAPVAGAIHTPFLSQTYVAGVGEGAWLTTGSSKSRRLRVSDREPSRALVATGFPFRRKDRLPRYLRALTGALERFEDLRRPGAASLDLAWTGAGVFDGFFELGLAPWDVAAGGLIIQEAGGMVTDWNGGTRWLDGDILAGSPAVHAELLAIARETA